MDSDDNQSEPPSSRRRTTRSTAWTSRAEALERLRSLRRGERRPQNSYQFKIEDPIYDTVDEDEYSALVAKRKSEFSNFVVEDENGDSGLGYWDDGEEEDWTKVGVEMSDGEGEEEEELEEERRKRKKTEKKEKEGQGKRPSGLMMAAEAIMGKQRISSMFTSSVFKRRGEDKGKLGWDSIVDDVIAEFAPDEDDRERRKRGGIGMKLGLGGVSYGRIESRTDFCGVGFGRIDHVDGAEDKRWAVEHCGQLIDSRSEEKGVNVEERSGVMVEEVKHEENSNGKSENGVLTESANVPMNEVVVDKGTELVERNSEPKVKEEEKRHLNAKFEGRKDQTFNAAAEWQAIRSARVDDSGVKKMQASPDLNHEEKSDFELESDGSLPFYILDAHEEIYGVNTGVVYLFGKVKVGNTFHSCCVIVKNMQRCVYAIPNDSVFRSEEVMKIEEDLAQSKISADDFHVKLQGITSGLKQEIANKLLDLNVSTFSMAPVKRNYAFDRTDIPVGENYVLKINYPFKDPPIPSDLKGNTFRAVLGTHSSALELFLIKREIKGPSWLSVSKFSSCPSNQKVSWCKFEITVDCPKDIQASTSSRITAEIPPVVVTAINLKTVINGKQNVNEIISASIISCTKAKIDSPMLASEWKTPGVLSHFTVVRKLEGGIFPMGFTKDVSDKNAKGGSNSFGCESSERALLNRLMIELYKLDSDVIVGHNISGFDLDALLQRAQVGPPWLAILVVSYSLTHLAKSQLNKDRKEIAPHEIPKMFETSDSLMKLGARAQRVEYLLLHAFHGKKYIVPDKYTSHGKETKLIKRKVDQNNDMDAENANAENEILHDDHEKGKKGPAYAGGLVLEPKRGLYDKYILLLDFNSLYPSIIQEYNICFTTVERPDDGSIPRLPSSSRTGVLPELLKGLVERRRKVKNWLKNAKGLKAQQFDIQQQALKLTANSMYGCLGFSNSRFYAKPLAELITLQGREILQSTVDLVRNNLNLEVIYGDTDSIMIHSGLDDFSKAKEIAGKVIQEVNKKYRCLEIDLDGMYKRMLLLKKKKYAAVKVQFKNDQEYEIIERKGLDMVRRDWSLLSKELGDFCLSQILSARSCEDVVESIHNSLMKVQEEMRNGEVALEKYVITKTLTKPPEAYPDAKNQPHVQVALRLKQSGYSSGSSAGDTVPYVICCEQGSTLGKSAGIAQRARHPDELKRDNENWMIDIEYYLSQQIHPVVSRLCACIQGTSPARLADCLGLDPTKFQSRTSDPVSDEPPSLLLSSTDDEESVSSYISKLVIGNNSEAQAEDTSGNFWQKLQCPKCPTEGENGHLSPVMIANQGPNDGNTLVKDTFLYSEADLYKQLQYFCHVLDTVHCIQKMDANARVAAEKELARVRALAELAASTAQKMRDRCAYGWISVFWPAISMDYVFNLKVFMR
ncbi:DNA polymerase alpha catalytic subunit-like protein [Drosera capensis]